MVMMGGKNAPDKTLSGCQHHPPTHSPPGAAALLLAYSFPNKDSCSPNPTLAQSNVHEEHLHEEQMELSMRRLPSSS